MEKSQFVDIITKIDPILLADALDEISKIDWDIIRAIDNRHTNPSFKTSTALHLRVAPSLVSSENTDAYIEYIGTLLEAVDSSHLIHYPKLKAIMDWVHAIVSGKRVGRTMLVKLSSRGKIPLHIDPGPYFQIYKRFHVVFKTHPAVYFIGPDGISLAHMPEHYLCQLNNINMHGVLNDTDCDRIHLIIDIETDDPRFAVAGPP